MKYIAGAYRSFRTADDTQVAEEVAVWHDILQDIPTEIAIQKTRELCRINTKFAPTPAEIYQACTEPETYSIYELQRREQEQQLLELKEYHEREEVKPMPDHIANRLEKLFASMRVNNDES
ncbi:replicative helicase loader/inhibitor [Paenibacillus algicola]|uniref:replicative helicase loader/inhibitor n=1 Tax=Paenibacillus algicola TaxID=2565926 RepID=UPI001C30AA43|nr:replicative helicase loader/inhibitor [Paenibacillus algicola]